ncbi:unnamed protein product [Phytomonas sp. EM1]|nr:unnamed protein product [Phytomonas sp. EM1]|eukprot:CCW62432.1 unnamed protein product [Phytomonas sp. isolate EM1]
MHRGTPLSRATHCSKQKNSTVKMRTPSPNGSTLQLATFVVRLHPTEYSYFDRWPLDIFLSWKTCCSVIGWLKLLKKNARDYDTSRAPSLTTWSMLLREVEGTSQTSLQLCGELYGRVAVTALVSVNAICITQQDM